MAPIRDQLRKPSREVTRTILKQAPGDVYISVIVGECGGAACSKPLAELLPLADEYVARAVEARQFTERQLRVDENIPTSLACCKSAGARFAAARRSCTGSRCATG